MVNEIQDKLLKDLEEISVKCKDYNWDGDNSFPITKITIDHGKRFVSKLLKYDLLKDYLTVKPVSDDNLSFEWKLKKNNTTFTIDFDRSTDTLVYCLFDPDKPDDIRHGNVSHLEQIVPSMKRIFQIVEKEKENQNA